MSPSPTRPEGPRRLVAVAGHLGAMCAAEDWPALAERAGAPAPRLFEQTQRLFGASAPAVRLWHDSAAWHPFANQVWLLLEAMQLPHVRNVVPLSQYRKPRDAALLAAFEEALPGASPDALPYVQLRDKSGRWGPAMKERTAVALLGALGARFPSHKLLPRTPGRRAHADALLGFYPTLQAVMYGVLGGGATPEAQRKYVAAMDSLEGAYSTPRRGPLALGGRAFPDDGDGAAERFGGPVDAGPFLFGERACAFDVLLLPLLERCEANVPHPVVGGLPHLPLSRWPSLTALLARARRPGGSPVAPLLSDATTTAGIRLAVTGMAGSAGALPEAGGDVADLARAAEGVEQAARRDAAARLCAKGAAVAGFAASGSGTGRARAAAGQRGAAGAEVVAAVDAALRATAQLLLAEGADGGGARRAAELQALAEGAAERVAGYQGREAARRAAEALVFLAENTGVPRDMDGAAAHAFRAHLAVVSAALLRTRGRAQ